MSEITISWDKSPTPGATYNIYRGTALGNEAIVPYATGITNPAPLALTDVQGSVGAQAVYDGTITGGASNALAGEKVTITGFTNTANNGTFTVVSSTATSAILNNSLAVTETHAANFLLAPNFTDTVVLPGKIYSYEITSVVSGVESADSVQLLSAPVPFPFSPTTPDLALASSFEILAATTATNTGTSIIGGDIGVYPGTALTGFGSPTTISGVLHAGDFVAQNAQTAASAAFTSGMALTPNTTLSATTFELGGSVLVPGVYSVGSAASVSTNMIFNGGGNPNASWIFQIGSTLVTSASVQMVCTNGAQAQNITWLVGSATTLGATSVFHGNVISQTAVTLGNGVIVDGRLFSLTAAVTLIGDTVNLILASSLSVYAADSTYSVGTIVFDCASQTYQQVAVEGTTGAVHPTFSQVLGSTVLDGTVLWVEIDPELAVLNTGLPPSPPNTPPAPPAGPQNPRISSEA